MHMRCAWLVQAFHIAEIQPALAGIDSGGGSMRLSARNVIAGKVTRIAKGATTSIVHLDCDGTAITASITNEAVAELGLAEGQAAHAVIKASDVMIAVD
jgi:molybdopterin-binding protein